MPGEVAALLEQAMTNRISPARRSAVIPSDHISARFHACTLYEEDFVIAVRAGHPFADDPTLERYCEMQHLVVSFIGDRQGFVDEALSGRGYSRRIVLTVANFMYALAIIAETDLISALPRRFVAMHATRFEVSGLDAPLPLRIFSAQCRRYESRNDLGCNKMTALGAPSGRGAAIPRPFIRKTA